MPTYIDWPRLATAHKAEKSAIEELDEAIIDLQEELNTAETVQTDMLEEVLYMLEARDDELLSEAQLKLREELRDVEGYCEDFHHGETLIRSGDAFVDYAQQLAEDCGMVPDNRSWPLNCIDWDFAARELAHDYSEVEVCGVNWMVR